MKFSIIIPAHNAGKYLGRALESIRAQHYKDYELIVICDSCEDNTKEVAESYGAITKVVEYHRDGLTRNRGLDLAQGQYILFMDADDWWLHEYVLSQINDCVTINPQADIILFSFIYKTLGYCCQAYKIFPAVWNKIWKRSIIGDTRFNDRQYGSDLFFQRDIFNKNPNMIVWDMPLYYYNYLGENNSLSERHDVRHEI